VLAGLRVADHRQVRPDHVASALDHVAAVAAGAGGVEEDAPAGVGVAGDLVNDLLPGGGVGLGRALCRRPAEQPLNQIASWECSFATRESSFF